MYYPPQQQGFVPPPYPPRGMGMPGGFVPPPAPNMVPQGMYPVTMGGQPRPGPYPPQQPQQQPPQQTPPSYPSQPPPMAQPSSQPSSQPTPAAIDSLPLQMIDTLGDKEVEELLQGGSKFDEYVKRLPLVQDYLLRQQSVNQLQQEVDALAARISGNSELEAVRVEMEQKRAELQGKTAQKQAMEGQLTPAALYEKLDAMAKAIDAECEDIASKFLAGDMSAQDFAKAYKEKRFHYHSLSAKKESILHNM